ncbi:MAG: sugar transferase [bacterium]
MKNRLKIARVELLLLFLKMPTDLIMIVLAFVLAYFIRLEYFGPAPNEFMPLDQYIKNYVLLVLPLWVLVASMNGLYNRKNQGLLSDYNQITTSVSLIFMFVLGFLFLTRTLFFSRLLIMYAWIITIILVSVGRSLIWLIQKFIYSKGIGIRKVIIIGTGTIAQSIAHQTQKNGEGERQVLAFIDTGNSKKRYIMSLPVIKGFQNLEKRFDYDDISEIIWTGKGLDSNAAFELVSFCQDEKIRFRYVPNLFETRSTNIDLETIAGIPVISLRKTPLEGWGRIFKRAIDVISSVFGLIISFPLFIITAITIKLDSKGPIFFIQKRVGEDSEFSFYKFRTMIKDAPKLLYKVRKDKKDTGPFINVKVSGDPRITKVGRFLRKTSLDELPQLINVLKGEMSLVGPRPLAPEESKDVEAFEKQYRVRRYVKPGMTGLWQVSGRSEMTTEERIRLDIYYTENWSLLLDIQIIIKTFWRIISKKGAV